MAQLSTWAGRLALCALLGLALAACGAGAAEPSCQADPACLRYGVAADIPILDPHLSRSTEAGIILRQIFDTLVYRDSATSGFVPGLASDWQVSPDGLQYTFQLRDDLVFHDGARFDAAAVARNLDRIQDAQLPAEYARELLGPLTRYELVDDFTIGMTLASPYPALLDRLAQPFLGIASPAALDQYNHLRHQFYLSGTGPFRLEAYTPGESVELRRFEDYRVNPAIYDSGAGGNIERVVFDLRRREAGDALAGLDGALDVIGEMAPAAAQNLAGNSRIQLLPSDIPGLAAQFLFNTRREHVNRREVRLALLLATDRAAIVDQAYYNYSPVAWAPLSLSSGYAHTGYINRYALDVDAARDVLGAAGYADADGDGIVESDGAALSLSIVVPPWGGMPQVASMLQRQWRAIGVELNIEPVPSATRLNDLIASGQYDLLPVERYGLDPLLLSAVFLDSGAYAASRAPNPQLNELVVSALAQLDPDLRRKQVYAIQALIMDEALILPIRDVLRLTAARADLVNLRFDAYGFYPLLRDARLAGG